MNTTLKKDVSLNEPIRLPFIKVGDKLEKLVLETALGLQA